MSSLGENISQEANSSNDDVKDRAKAEFEDEERRAIRLDNDIKEQDKDERNSTPTSSLLQPPSG